MKKRVFYTELAYVIGLLILALGTAFMERTGFGVSMVVAPAYLVHLKISQFLPFFSFGMSEYTFQAVVLLIMIIIIRKVKLSYFFSFVTAVIYGLMLDTAISLVAFIPWSGTALNIVYYVLGMLLCCSGVSLLFHTYISPEAYELFVIEISAKFGFNIHKFKTVYDCSSCIISIALSFIFFGLWHFEGISFGTILCALLNGTIINIWTHIYEKIWVFEDKFKLRKYF